MEIVVDRDCVANGDDYCHLQKFHFDEAPNLRDFLEKVAKLAYLAIISGGKATWVVRGEGFVAVMAQQWRKPKFLIHPLTPALDVASKSEQFQFYLEYRRQIDPNELFRSLTHSD